MRIAAALSAAIALAFAEPALATGPTPHPPVHAAPAPSTDEDTLPAWLLPAGVVAAVLVAALALRRM